LRPPPTSPGRPISFELLDSRSRDVLARRQGGATLDAIGKRHGVGRERVRQLENAAGVFLAECYDRLCPDWRHAVREVFDNALVVSEELLGEALVEAGQEVVGVLARVAGGELIRVWGDAVPGYWTTRQGQLDNAVHRLVELAPYAAGELAMRAEAHGMPTDFSIKVVFGHERSPLTMASDESWIRRRSPTADPVYLWLLGEGEPRAATEIVLATDVNKRTLNAALHKDDRFRLVLPERIWGLTSWPVVSGATRYSGALEAVVDVIERYGPLTKRQLYAEVREVFPVSPERVRQCLDDGRIGELEDGRVDLVTRGAVHPDEPEPVRPQTLVVDGSGQRIALRVRVDMQVLRGSGVPAHTWLTWRLAMHSSPMSTAFDPCDGSEPLVVTRRPGGAQLSTLRARVTALGMVLGCDLFVVMNLARRTVTFQHGCKPGSCGPLPT